MNKKLILPALLAASIFMASCSSDEIVARPSWIDNKIAENVDTKDNQMKLIYDAIKNLGDTNSNLLNKILFDMATKTLGTPEEIEKFSHPENATDEAAFKSEFKNFIAEHPYYNPVDNFKVVLEGGNRVKKDMDEEDKLSFSLKKVENFHNQLFEDVSEKLYNEIKGGSYSTDGLFSEERYVMNLRKNLYHVPTLNQIKDSGIILNEEIELLPKGLNDTYNSYIKRVLSVDTNSIPGYKEITGFDKINPIYSDYINKKLLPDLYRTYLIRTYVKEQRYSSLGRTYARKVKMITVPNGGDTYKASVNKMFNFFAKKYIVDHELGYYDFGFIETAMKGFVGDKTTVDFISNKAYELLSNGSYEFPQIKIKDNENKDVPLVFPYNDEYGIPRSTHVFKGTKLGDLVEKLQKYFDFKYHPQTPEGVDHQYCNFDYVVKKDGDKSVYNEFTGTGEHSFEHGLELKIRDIRQTTYTKEGWYQKNGGLSELNATYRDNLFNIAVSNIVDSDNEYEKGDYARYYTLADGIKSCFLTTKVTATAPDEQLIVLDDGSNYMILEIEEAVSTSKLSTNVDNTNSYRYLKAMPELEEHEVMSSNSILDEIADEVVKVVADGDTYKNNANQYYLLLSNVLFHDESVYNYFKSQYPDLVK